MRSTLKIFLCIVSFCISGVSFAQDLNARKRTLNESKRAKLLARGMSEQESAETIARWNTVIEEAYAQRIQTQREEMARMQAAASSGNANRSTMDVSATEKAALQALFNGNGGTNWTNNSGWDFNTDVTSSWYGVTVTNGHVTGLTLINNNLINSLPAAIGQLTHLTTLNLFSNHLTGSIPTQISALTNLQTLNLSTNDLTGSIPSQIGQLTALKYLYLDRNDFSGSIPTQIGQLSALLELDLDSNNLTGSIPAEIGNLVTLKKLSINNNPSLTGAIPTEIGNLVNMEYLYFISDDLTFLPPSMGNMTNLKMVYINNDQMTGQIPPGWGSATNLLRLQVDVCKLSGPIPAQLANLSNLQTLALGSNELSGDIPDLTGLNNLFLLSISRNKFRFIDFVNENNAYLSNPTLTNYSYNDQAKTDSVVSVSAVAGSSVTFEMSADGPPTRYTINDTFQWYKGVYPNGTLIPGATLRTFTIPSLVAGDAGSYYCLSKHPQMTIPSDVRHNLVLVRNQIQLTVTATPSLGACAETFEGATFPPAGWLVANNGVGTQVEWVASTGGFMCPGLGTKSAHIATQNIGAGQTSQDWLITPKVTVPANGELRFFSRQQLPGDALTQFDIKVSPVSQPQNNLGAYTLVQNFPENALPQASCSEQKVNLSAYAGQDVYIAFVRTKTQPSGSTVGDGWIVDNVRVVSKCGQPVYPMSTSNVQQNSLVLSWASVGAPSYNVEYGVSGTLPGNGTVVNSTTNSITISGLTAGTAYQFYVTPICNNCGTYPGEISGPFNTNTLPAGFCPQPTNLVITNPTGTTATLGWTEAGSATTWVIAVNTFAPGGGIGPNPTYITTTQNPYTITGLQPDSAYKFSVMAKCANGDSDWSTIIHGDLTYYDCAKKDPEFAQNVKHLFLDMVNELLTIMNNGGTIPNGYTSAAVVAMQPYITDPNAKIYNFSYVDGVVSFSFAPHAGAPRKDVIIHKYGSSYGLLTEIDLAYFLSPNIFMDNVPASFQFSSSNISVKHIKFCDVDMGPCTVGNPRSAIVQNLFIQLVNHLHDMASNGQPIPDGYNCPQLMALAPYLLDSNLRIYNFDAYPFSFSFHQPVEGEDPKFDVLLGDWTLTAGVHIANFSISEFNDPTQFMVLDGDIDYSNGKDADKARIRHVNFCPDEGQTDPCPNPIVKQLYLNLLNHLHQRVIDGNPIPDGYSCAELDALRPYLTDPRAAIYNFNAEPFFFSFHQPGKEDEKFDVFIERWPYGPNAELTDIDLSGFLTPTEYTDAPATMADGTALERTRVRHVNFCPDTSCSRLPEINQLFVNLLNHLHEMTAAGNPIPDGYTCPELAALAPYITDPNPRIYNFHVDPFSFSFHPIGKEETPRYDVLMSGWTPSMANIASIDLSTFSNPDELLNLDGKVTLTDGRPVGKVRVRHIDFCPDSDNCSRMPEINQLFVNLLNHLHEVAAGGNPIPDGYTCPQLTALAPYLTDANPGIYNFQADPFSFSFHPIDREEEPKYDVYIEKWGYPSTTIASINLSNYDNPYDFTSLNGMITLSDGYVLEKATVRHIIFCPDSDTDCSRMPEVTQLFIDLLSRLHEMAAAGVPIPNGYTCPQLEALAPYITDANPGIYNFQADPFSFSFHPIGKEEHPPYDVIIEKWEYPGSNIASINMANYNNPYAFTSLNGMITLGNGQVVEKAKVRHINFCPPATIDCELKPRIAELFKSLLNHMHKMVLSGDADDIIDGYDCAELAALRPYLTDPNAMIYNFNVEPFYFSFHPIEKNENPQHDVFLHHWQINDPGSDIANIDMVNYVGPENFTNLDFKVTLANGNTIEDGEVRHIDFCPEEVNYCITGNPKATMVKNLFIALLNHLHDMAMSGTPVPDGYSCAELVALTPYITDTEPKIYQFSPTDFSFSFHDSKEATFDVAAPQWSGQSSDINTIDLVNYQSPTFYTSLDSKIVLANGYVIRRAQVRHVNFCPDDFCVNHVAIVVDESGSLTELEKIKIRRQLKKFVQQQAANNQVAPGGNMHISLIGMSDRDANMRSDHKIALKITPANLGVFEAWIDDYGNRYGEPGISQGSDFWASGLQVALDAARKPDLVIMITDGCQTESLTTLDNVMKKFDNYAGNENRAFPHLYVVGIKDGFYVHNTTQQDARMTASAANTKAGSRSNDPNYNPSLTSSTSSFSDEGNVTSSLQMSLKFLFGLGDLDFPSESLNEFQKDYFGHETFQLIGEDHHYLSDRVKIALDIDCGTLSDQNPCDDCFSFRPEADKVYVLNAWVKEELKAQVTSYEHPKIRVVYINEFKIPFASELFSTVGPIIDGWQRLGGKFDIPAETEYIDFELLNLSTVAPAFYDDIRIYPVKGTMKSFVYDPETFRLMSELDENNYATFYEYDKEGGLVRVKKETAEGIKTIQETRSGNYLKVQE